MKTVKKLTRFFDSEKNKTKWEKRKKEIAGSLNELYSEIDKMEKKRKKKGDLHNIKIDQYIGSLQDAVTFFKKQSSALHFAILWEGLEDIKSRPKGY